MSNFFRAAMLLALLPYCFSSHAQLLTLDYARKHTQGGSYPYTNDQCIDLVSGKFIAMGFGINVQPRMHLYNLVDGAKSSPEIALYNHDNSVRPAQHWSGFGVCSKNGMIFYFDNNDAGGNRLARLDSVGDTQATAVSAPGTMQFSRNMTIEGIGADTWIASVGQGNAGAAHVRMLKAVDDTLTSFAVAGTVTGAGMVPAGTGKAGVGMSPPAGDGTPPLYLVTADVVGAINRLRLFKRTGAAGAPDMGYTRTSEILERCVDAKFDMADGQPDRLPVVIALMRTRTTTDSAQLAMFTFPDGQLTEIARLGIPKPAVQNLDIAERGSVEIDRANKKVYVTWTGTESPFMMNHVAVGRISYDLPLVPVFADLALEKSSDATSPSLGINFSYQLTVRNNGTGPANDVTVTDTLPPEVEFVSATSSAGTPTHSAGIVTCSVGALAPTQSQTLTITVRAVEEGPIANVASVESSESDANAADNLVVHDDVVVRRVGLSISQTDTPDPVGVGERVTYNVTVGNTGASSAESVRAEGEVTGGGSGLTVTAGGAACTVSGNSWACDIGPLAASDDRSISVEIFAPATTGTLEHRASVTGDGEDADLADNSSVERTSVTAASDLKLVKQAQRDQAQTGELVSFMLTVTNDGPATATNVTLHDTLPESLAYELAASAQGNCTREGAQIRCELGAVAPGASVVSTVVARAVKPGEAVNVASVGSEISDPNPANNESSATVTIGSTGIDLTAAWRGEVQRICRRDGNCFGRGYAVISNQGSASCRITTVRFYLSADENLDPGDTLVSTRRVLPIRAGRYRLLRFQALLPNGAAASGWRIIAVADANSEISETDETNNTAASPPMN